MKKLAIYVHYDPKGEIHNYVFFALEKIRKIYPELIFVVNGSLNDEAKQKVEELEINILQRENIGFDFAAWKYALEKCGYENISKYDELLLTNNSFYGPLFDLEDMYSKMGKKICDFWGITKHRQGKRALEHIQSYWLVFKNSILKSDSFKNFWQELPNCTTFLETVQHGELRLTNYFETNGFKSAVFVENFVHNTHSHPDISSFSPDILLSEHACPILKRKIFISTKHEEYFNNILTNKVQNALDFVKNKTKYDENLIWEDILKSASAHTLMLNLNLNYTLSSYMTDFNYNNEKIALILYLTDNSSLPYIEQQASNFPNYCNIFLFTSNEALLIQAKNKLEHLENIKEYVLIQENKKPSTLLLEDCECIFKKYEYMCFLHAKLHSIDNQNIDEKLTNESFEHFYLNLSYSKKYIENVLQLFKKNKQFGLLFPPQPVHENYLTEINTKENYINKSISMPLQTIAKDEQNLKVYDTMFWCKTSAVLPLLESYKNEESNNIKEFYANNLGKILPYAIQENGYANAIIMSDNYAKVYVKNLNYLHNRNKDSYTLIQASSLLTKILCALLSIKISIKEKLNSLKAKPLNSRNNKKIRKIIEIKKALRKN